MNFLVLKKKFLTNLKHLINSFQIATYLGNNNAIRLAKNLDGNSPSASFKLPNGAKDDEYQVYLYVKITDDSDGYALYNIETPVVVLPNYNIVLQYAESFLNENPVNLSTHNLTFNSSLEENKSLVDILKNSDVQTVSTFIMIFTTMLNSLTPASSNSSNTTFSFSPNDTNEVTKFKEIMIINFKTN